MPLKFASLHPWCHFSSTTTFKHQQDEDPLRRTVLGSTWRDTSLHSTQPSSHHSIPDLARWRQHQETIPDERHPQDPSAVPWDSKDDHAKMTTAPLDEGWRQLMGQGSTRRSALPWDPATLESLRDCGASQLTGSPGWPPGALTGLGLLRKEPCPALWWLPDEEMSSQVPLIKIPDVSRRKIKQQFPIKI